MTGLIAIFAGSKTALQLRHAWKTPSTGGYSVETEHFIGEHAPLNLSTAGTVIVEARRHLLDFGEMTDVESGDLGQVLRRLVPAIKAETGAHVNDADWLGEKVRAR